MPRSTQRRAERGDSGLRERGGGLCVSVPLRALLWSGASQGGQAVLAGEAVELPWQHPGEGCELIADAVQLGTFEGCAGKEEWIACAACGQAGVDDPAEWFYAGPAKASCSAWASETGVSSASVTISTRVYAGSCRRISGVVMCPGTSLAPRMTWR